MTQDVNFYDKPLSDEEFVEIGELLALMPEPYESMEPDRMDGFLTAIALLPEPVAPSEWMPFVFDEEGRSDAALTDSNKQHDLEDRQLDAHAGIERGLGVAAHGDDLTSERALAQEELADDHDHDHPEKQHRNAAEVAAAEHKVERRVRDGDRFQTGDRA